MHLTDFAAENCFAMNCDDVSLSDFYHEPRWSIDDYVSNMRLQTKNQLNTRLITYLKIQFDIVRKVARNSWCFHKTEVDNINHIHFNIVNKTNLVVGRWEIGWATAMPIDTMAGNHFGFGVVRHYDIKSIPASVLNWAETVDIMKFIDDKAPVTELPWQNFHFYAKQQSRDLNMKRNCN